MIRDFSNSAKKKLLEYVKDATETTLWRKVGDRIGDAGLQIQYWFGALSISKYIDNLDAYHKKIIEEYEKARVAEQQKLDNKINYDKESKICQDFQKKHPEKPIFKPGIDKII